MGTRLDLFDGNELDVKDVFEYSLLPIFKRLILLEFRFQFIEVLYGLACSTEVAYFTYIYAKVDRDKYKKVTSYTYSAIFFGRFFAGVAAQALVSYNLMDYLELNYISLTCVSIAFCFALMLPSVNQSIYFYRNDKDGTSIGE